MLSITKNELEVLELLWQEQRPLSKSEIIELSPNRSWKSSSIHLLLNKLLDKKLIEISGFVKTRKNYGRTFQPLISEQDYYLSQLEQNLPKHKFFTKNIFAALIENNQIDEETINEIEQLIKERKKL